MLKGLLVALAAAVALTAAGWLLTLPGLSEARRHHAELASELAPLATADEAATAFHDIRRELELRIQVVTELRRHQDDLAASWAAIDPLLDPQATAFLTLTRDTAEISVTGGEEAALALAGRLEELSEIRKVEVHRMPSSSGPASHAVQAQRVRRVARPLGEIDSP